MKAPKMFQTKTNQRCLCVKFFLIRLKISLLVSVFTGQRRWRCEFGLSALDEKKNEEETISGWKAAADISKDFLSEFIGQCHLVTFLHAVHSGLAGRRSSAA